MKDDEVGMEKSYFREGMTILKCTLYIVHIRRIVVSLKIAATSINNKRKYLKGRILDDIQFM